MRRVEIPAREGRAVEVAAGTSVRVVDVEGGQVADTWAFVAGDPREYASAEHTRPTLSRLFPRIGESFVTNRRRPVLLLEEDTSPGVHDFLIAACDPTRYELLGVPGHASCQANLRAAMAALGHDDVEVPQPINLFMNTPTDGDAIEWKQALSRAGDYVRLRAELDLVLVVSACPQDLVAINEGGPTSLAVEVL